ALRAGPDGNLLAQSPVELPEVVLDLSEVGHQLSCGAGELLVALALRDRVEHVDLTELGPLDLGVQLLAAPVEVCEALGGVAVGAVHHLAKQLKDRVESGLGADEGPGLEVGDPGERLLDRRSQVVVGFVSARWVELAEPTV